MTLSNVNLAIYYRLSHCLLAYANIHLHPLKALVLCHRFKLCLADDYGEKMRLPAGLTPLRVIAAYLQFLGDFALAKLCEQWGSGKVAAKDVVWAMTVPAAWSESAKQTMRQVAAAAGLVTHPSSRYACICHPWTRRAAVCYNDMHTSVHGRVQRECLMQREARRCTQTPKALCHISLSRAVIYLQA